MTEKTDNTTSKEKTAESSPKSKSYSLSNNKEQTTSLNEGQNTLSRKRTRDDFEEDDKVTDLEPKERIIAPLKKKKSVSSIGSSEVANDSALNTETKDEVKDAEASESEKADSKQKIESKETEGVNSEDVSSKPLETEKLVDESSKASENKNREEENHDEKGDSKDEREEKKKEEKDTDKVQDTKPRFVFGATTPFGANAFSLVDKSKNVFDSKPSAFGQSSGSSNKTTSVFGSSSTFGNAFQSAINKESIFDKGPETSETKTGEEETNEKTETDSNPKSHLYKQVELEKTEIKSGEENEEQVFTCRAKLYALDLTNVSQGWKERGTGNVHVNKSRVAGKRSRIIMRSTGLLKVILNTALVQGLEVVKGMPSSLSSEKFIRVTSLEDGKPIQYAIKTGNVETTDSLFESIIDNIAPSV